MVSALLMGDAGFAEELNSERIARLFGSYGVHVLEEHSTLRVSSLYSVEPAGPVCRTLATVQFAEPLPAALGDAHRAIIRGGSIGATLRRSGWQLEKRHRYIGETEIPATASRLETLMKISGPVQLAVHVYDLEAWRDGERHRYATLVEMHHPDYLDADQLRSIYGPAPDTHLASADIMRLTDIAREKMVAPAQR